MRLPVIHALLFTFFGLAGCSGGASVDALQIAEPSRETTGSIVRPDVGIPGAGSGEVIASATEAGMSALAETEHVNAPAFEQVALNMPPKPALRPAGKPSGGKVYSQKFRDAKPVNFGKVTPQHHAVHGVDVSRWQGEIDWATLRGQGANFAYIKATDGGDHLDPMFRKNWDAAARAGLRRGAYHFFYWCRTAAEQADWFIRNVPKVKGALPPVIDVEYNHQSDCKRRWPRADILEKMQVFMDRLERHYGQRPIIYTAPDFYGDNLQGAFPNHPFWLRAVAEHPSKVYPGRDWVFWQYSGSGLSQGVNGKIDLNVFRGDERAWWNWVGQVAG
ncbi:GH25 family lysozyme [Nitratireductor luteus]|uniref:glycoside hydrolase family 25 protein n=1 Tax=Nitratireductor luteus TaxID=2976980 RepID=UPI00223FA364|nr:GH25 family lysozyme [Nitratireductor luteus]